MGSIVLATLLTLGTTGCGSDSSNSETKTAISATNKTSVLTTYANIALANYTDALNDAKALNTALDTFVANPTQTNMDSAKAAWKVARVSYGTTEIFRLSDGPIDGEGDFSSSFGAPITAVLP